MQHTNWNYFYFIAKGGGTGLNAPEVVRKSVGILLLKPDKDNDASWSLLVFFIFFLYLNMSTFCFRDGLEQDGHLMHITHEILGNYTNMICRKFIHI